MDGLELFKKNVSAHFENKTECAICYSYAQIFFRSGSGSFIIRIYRLISAADGNLPNKPCQTCKNSFHASCLYEVRVYSCLLPPVSIQLMVVASHTVVQEQSLVELSPLSFEHY